MRSTLFEFYKPDEVELKKAWDTGIFTFDANVLLNLYRYSSKTTSELFDILKHLNGKIWLTHQAGYEYLNNRLSVIYRQKIAYDEVKNILSKKLTELSNELNSYKKHSSIETDRITDSVKRAFEVINSQIDKLGEAHPTYEPQDGIRDRLTNLFEGKIGKPFDKTRLAEIFKEGEIRYESEVPPGFKDRATKKDEPKTSLYGDLILWKQVMFKAKEVNKPVILVTDDLKEDWWDKFKGESQGPRKELLREFFDETGQNIYIYQADKFLEYANKLKIGKTVKEEAIKEIRDVRIKDEQQLRETAESLSKALEKQIKSFDQETYKRFLEKFDEQVQIYRSAPDVTKQLQESIENYRRFAEKMQHKSLYPFTDQQKESIRRMIEKYGNLGSGEQGDKSVEDKSKFNEDEEKE